MTNARATRRTWPSLVCASLFAIAPLRAARAQTSVDLATAKSLYASARYDDALAALGQPVAPEARIYRALCLLALGRQDDARSTLEELVTGAPSFKLTGEDLPPRFVSLFQETRQTVLPSLVRELFASGRRNFQGKAYAEAVQDFDRAIALLGDPAAAADPDSPDLRLLATSYADLARTELERIAAEAEAALERQQEAAAAAAAADAATDDDAGSPASTSPAEGTMAAAQPREPVITPPVPLRQVFPSWPAGAGRSEALVGRLRLTIDEEGRVRSAVMDVPMSPVYDPQLIEAASSWLYRPALRDGVPVAVEHVVDVRLNR